MILQEDRAVIQISSLNYLNSVKLNSSIISLMIAIAPSNLSKTGIRFWSIHWIALRISFLQSVGLIIACNWRPALLWTVRDFCKKINNWEVSLTRLQSMMRKACPNFLLVLFMDCLLTSSSISNSDLTRDDRRVKNKMGEWLSDHILIFSESNWTIGRFILDRCLDI